MLLKELIEKIIKAQSEGFHTQGFKISTEGTKKAIHLQMYNKLKEEEKIIDGVADVVIDLGGDEQTTLNNIAEEITDEQPTRTSTVIPIGKIEDVKTKTRTKRKAKA